MLAVSPALAGVASMEEALSEKVLGKADAPVTIIEYSSLGCSHCAAFHKDTLPEIKKNYIDTGKAKLILRDFPLGGPALAAAMLARCSGNARYFGFVEMLFRSQESWAMTNDPLGELGKVARIGGMGEADFNTCLQNEKLMKALQDGMRKAQLEHDVEATPTFIVGDTRIPGALPYVDFKKVLDEALAKAK